MVLAIGSNVIAGNGSSDIDISTLIESIYPIGSIYITILDSCPIQELGIGTWEKVGTSLTINVNTNVPVKSDGKTPTFVLNSGTTGYLYSKGDGFYYANGLYLSNSSGGQLLQSPGVIKFGSQTGLTGTVTRTQLTVNIFKRIS